MFSSLPTKIQVKAKLKPGKEKFYTNYRWVTVADKWGQLVWERNLNVLLYCAAAGSIFKLLKKSYVNVF